VVIDHGRVIAEGTSDQLKDQIGGDRITVQLARPGDRDEAVRVLAGLCTGSVDVNHDGRTLSAPIRTGDRVVPGVVRALDEADVDILDIEVRRPTLDDVFLTITGRPPDDESGDETTAQHQEAAR
jgi:ABC-2 type transport system ATP-binding protein